MAKSYDAVVIGAGLGGLSAATRLARLGRRVLLLEKHNVPGGYATSFVRGRFEFEVALHELSGIGGGAHPGGLWRYLESLGVAEKIETVRIPVFYRSVFPDRDLRLPVGREAYEAAMCDAFPRDAAGIRNFLKRIHTLSADINFFYRTAIHRRVPGPAEIATLPWKIGDVARHALVTWGRMLNRDVKDPQARAVLSQIWGYFGLPPSKISYLYFAMGMASYIEQGPTYIKGRSQALSHAFVKAFEECGGEARFNAPVAKILVKGDRVTGVATRDGEEFATRCVISNVDPVSTCAELIGAEKTPERFWRRLRSCTVGASSFNVYLGLASPPEKFGLTDHETFVNADYDIESHWAKMKTLDPTGGVAVTCYNAVWPEISPPGTSIVVLTALNYGEPWRAVAPADYVATKNRIAAAMLDMVERVAPGLRERAEVIEVSTPVTNMRFAGQLGGSIYGFDQPPGEAAFFRLPHWGPLKGLYFAGAWTPPGGGFEPAIMSGRIAADVAAAFARSKGKGAGDGR
jgi:prolycopene isomerase